MESPVFQNMDIFKKKQKNWAHPKATFSDLNQQEKIPESIWR